MRSAVVLTLVLLGACSRSTAPHVTADDAARASARWPGTTTEELEHGRDLYVGHCSSCHLPPTPSDYAAEDWPGHISEMRERAHLDGATAEAIRKYVVTMAQR